MMELELVLVTLGSEPGNVGWIVSHEDIDELEAEMGAKADWCVERDLTLNDLVEDFIEGYTLNTHDGSYIPPDDEAQAVFSQWAVYLESCAATLRSHVSAADS